MPDPAANLSEVFSSLQGEGPYVGEKQMFVRFGGCNLRCDYCDTPASLVRVPSCDVGGRFEPNPVSLAHLLEHLEELDSARGPHQSVSCTGGEPLLQAEFLAAFLPEARRRGWRTYLETNGMWPEPFRTVAGAVDVAAVDLKLPSSIGRDFWNEHEAFLRIAREQGCGVFVKVIVAANSRGEELSRAVDLVEAVDRRIPLVFQPVTPQPASAECRGASSADGRMVAAAAAGARARLESVFVVPQMHRVLGVA